MIISPSTLISRKTTAATTPAAIPATPTTTSQAIASATAQASAPGGPMGEDQFMKLLIAQMQNQDPMNPMDGTQMASQLAQFSSLEQLQEMNQTLTGQSTSQGSLLGAIQSTAAISSIGHTVLASGNQIQVGGNAPSSSVTADFGSNAATATLKVYDSSGNLVGSQTLGAVGAGRQTFNLGDATKGLGDGTYTYSIDAADGAGNAVPTTTYMSGRVTGVSSTANGLTLNLGNLSVAYANIIEIQN